MTEGSVSVASGTVDERVQSDSTYFGELETLRRYLDELKAVHRLSLEKYYDSVGHGFAHLRSKPKTSRACTATCVMSLIAAGRWKGSQSSPYATELASRLLNEKWESAGLEAGNPFTVGWILETVTILERQALREMQEPSAQDIENPLKLKEDALKRRAEAEQVLISALKKEQNPKPEAIPKPVGAARIQGYAPSAYVTQLVVRALLARKKLDDEQRREVREWASGEMLRQLALITSDSKTADVYALLYALLVVVALSSTETTTPQDRRLQQRVLKELFEHQRLDGTWDLSQPLFHYPEVGNAYCYEYEMLVQLLEQKMLWDDLIPYLPHLTKAANALKTSAFPLGDSAFGWASGHHPQLSGPESWSTASVYHFVHVLDRLLAEAIRRTLYAYLDQPYPPQAAPLKTFAEYMLDSAIEYGGGKASLRETLLKYFVAPVREHAALIEEGQPLPKGTKTSAIFFGPPGTAKTTLARHIAEYLGWTLLMIDPSHLVRTGMDRVQAEANTVFSMLAAAERLVVLFDEFDELVRDRSAMGTEATSRFLTTAMLPKLTKINERRRIVFILATNYIDHFDFAISRPGRFDRIFQVMPPSAEEKLQPPPEVAKHLAKLVAAAAVLKKFKLITEDGRRFVDAEMHGWINEMTFDEYDMLATKLLNSKEPAEAVAMIKDATSRCTLERMAEGPSQNVKWRDRCEEQRSYIR